MAAYTAPAAELDLSVMTALIVDPDPYGVGVLSQILRGFGLSNLEVAGNGEAAMPLLSQAKYDLVICEAVLPDMKGADLVQWIRHQEEDPLRHVPVIMLTGCTEISNVIAARDSGINNMVRKPVSPTVLFDHIAWSAKTDRPFVEADGYIGPDRRFKFIGPPSGVPRRQSDLPLEIGEASEPNLSQSEIDAFVKPVKVAVE